MRDEKRKLEYGNKPGSWRTGTSLGAGEQGRAMGEGGQEAGGGRTTALDGTAEGDAVEFPPEAA
jgi:hypothetical protein